MRDNIYLIGYMGCGKTTHGKKLASLLGYKFVDTDQYISYQESLSIDEIFEKNGENHFRNLEHEAIKELSKQNGLVVSTGGGLPCFNNNIDIMNSSGITIYLELDSKSISNRVRQSKTNRPLLANKSDKELIEFIDNTLTKREKDYKKARLTISALNLTTTKLHEEINSEF